jgi:hypothetical protein
MVRKASAEKQNAENQNAENQSAHSGNWVKIGGGLSRDSAAGGWQKGHAGSV